MSFIHFSKNYLNWAKTDNSWEKGCILRFILFPRICHIGWNFSEQMTFQKTINDGTELKKDSFFIRNPIQPSPTHALFCPGGCPLPISLSPSLFYMHLHLMLWCQVTSDTLLLLLLVYCHRYFCSMATSKTDRPPPPVPHDMAGLWATHPRSHQGQTSTKQAHADKPSVQDVYIFGKDIQNCLPHEAFSPKATEDRCFCLFFGCGAAVALMAWQMLNAYGLGTVLHEVLPYWRSCLLNSRRKSEGNWSQLFANTFGHSSQSCLIKSNNWWMFNVFDVYFSTKFLILDLDFTWQQVSTWWREWLSPQCQQDWLPCS